MVNFSSLDDHERPDEVLYQFHSIKLVIALRKAYHGRFWTSLEVVFDGYVGKYYVTLPHSSSQTKNHDVRRLLRYDQLGLLDNALSSWSTFDLTNRRILLDGKELINNINYHLGPT